MNKNALDTILKDAPFWDQQPNARDYANPNGRTLGDVILQSRAEFSGLCAFIERNEVRSYLEVGIWTGRCLAALHCIHNFDRVAAADILLACSEQSLPLHLPHGTELFVGDSRSPEYLAWRSRLGPIDLVMIDGDHSYEGVKYDYEANARFPHRFVALHDIAGYWPSVEGVRRFWGELKGDKTELLLPFKELGLDHSILGIGIKRA